MTDIDRMTTNEEISMAPSPAVVAGEPVLREVADGVFAYVQPDGGWCVNNAGLIVSGKASVLVDTAATEARSRRLREQVLAEGRSAPSMLVNTHSHGDHTFGNYLFPEATVYAHVEARREMQHAGLHLTQMWPDVVWGDIEVALPQVTYRDGMTLHVGDLAVELLHPGPAHTVNDTVVWVPEHRVLFTGDIVMSGVTPFCPLGSITGSLKAIGQLRSLDPVTVVTGHGPVAGPEVLDVAEAYLRWVQGLAEEGVRAGLAPKDVAREADLSEFAGLLEPSRLIPNLHRAYAEERNAAHGEALDVGAMIKEMGTVFQEMADYNGGPLACHA
ncbi:MBL fold metallo-hydrolase [Streptomyces sp. NPDC048723]|uniref:MBL fold metallo-hydrolase n=1 Tax=unclassified Streptomyces TaxID=2593676 RepID=UPI0035612E1D